MQGPFWQWEVVGTTSWSFQRQHLLSELTVLEAQMYGMGSRGDVLVQLVHQLDWVEKCPYSGKTLFLDVFVRLFLEEMNI